MSTLQARAMADRVVVIRDTPTCAVASELAIDQASLLLRQLEIALGRARRFRAANTGPGDVAIAPNLAGGA